jgi:hypothetical protein
MHVPAMVTIHCRSRSVSGQYTRLSGRKDNPLDSL